jgi:hypothetical protein
MRNGNLVASQRVSFDAKSSDSALASAKKRNVEPMSRVVSVAPFRTRVLDAEFRSIVSLA